MSHPVPTPQALAELRSDLSILLAEMDELGLFQAGAHLAMSIHCLDQQADLPNRQGRNKPFAVPRLPLE